MAPLLKVGPRMVEFLGLAFVAGLLAFFSPCSVALVPAYIALYLPKGWDPEAPPPQNADGARAALVTDAVRGVATGLTVSAGFVTVFGAAGLAIFATQGAIGDSMPYLALASAALLLVLGAAMLAGRPISVTLKVFAPRKAGWASSYLFGVGYAFVSTGCLLPVFFLVVSAAVAAGAGGGIAGGASSALVLLAYAAGYTVLMVALSTYVAVTRDATLGKLRPLLPHIEKIAGAAVVASAIYIIWFDFTSVLPYV